MSGVDQLRAALAVKQGQPRASARRPIPNPIRFAVEGTHRACDGKTYTITYDRSPS